MEPFPAAVVQMAATPEKAANLAAADRLARRAAADGARLVVLPEVFSWRGPRGDEIVAAEPIPGPTSDHCANLAARLGIHLVAGSILEHGGPARKAYNTSCVFAPSGALLGSYRKIHLFDVDLPGRVQVRESDTRAPGKDPVVIETALGRIGLSVCYDLRFPELYRRLVRDGALLVTVPSAFTAPTGRAHWEVLLRTRAIENQVYVLAPNQFGTNAHGFEDYGHSMIVDPWGDVLARAGTDETVVTAEIDLARLATVRHEMPCLEHARLG
jgi:predicted amidohydrolase